MNLDETKKKQVAAWIDQGLKLSDIQKRMESEWGARVTYLEVRFLVDDLKLQPKDPAPLPPPPKPAAPSAPVDADAELMPDSVPGGRVSITVDQLTRPGSLASGKVKFSDGKSTEWYLDQMGRLGLGAMEKGYKPSATDLQEFQTALQSELQRMG